MRPSTAAPDDFFAELASASDFTVPLGAEEPDGTARRAQREASVRTPSHVPARSARKPARLSGRRIVVALAATGVAGLAAIVAAGQSELAPHSDAGGSLRPVPARTGSSGVPTGLAVARAARARRIVQARGMTRARRAAERSEHQRRARDRRTESQQASREPPQRPHAPAPSAVPLGDSTSPAPAAAPAGERPAPAPAPADTTCTEFPPC